MEIKLFREGREDPDRTYENQSPKECRRVRNRWINDVKKLPHKYYIISIPEDRAYDMNKFEEKVKRKQREREEYEQFCAEHGIHPECQRLSGSYEERANQSDSKECDFPVREQTELDNQ